jgi:hypothetical protein
MFSNLVNRLLGWVIWQYSQLYSQQYSQLKPVSQIHRFHLRLGYDALTACFLVISVGGRTVPILPQYCSSSFFHAVGAPIKAPLSLNFSLEFSECWRRAVQKNASQNSRTVAVRRLNWHRSAIFQCQYDFSSATCDQLLVCACKAPGGEQECPPTCHWKVAGRVEECDMLQDGGPWGLPVP